MLWALLLLAVALAVVSGTAAGATSSTLGAAYSAQSVSFAQAIAVAEGTLNADGSLNQNSLGISLNNPGDLEDSSGQLRTFATMGDGWNALYSQADAMLNGTSRIYRPSMTIAQAAYLYTGNDNAMNWARIVAAQLGVSITTTLETVNAIAA